MSDLLRDFKKHTSKKIVEAMKELPESRRDWLLDKFAFEARRTGRAENFKLW
jgi:putative transposase